MASKRKYLWMPFSSGTNETTIAASANLLLDLPSVWENALGVNFTPEVTLERLIFNFYYRASASLAVISVGFRIQHTSVTLAEGPVPDIHLSSDWFL